MPTPAGGSKTIVTDATMKARPKKGRGPLIAALAGVFLLVILVVAAIIVVPLLLPSLIPTKIASASTATSAPSETSSPTDTAAPTDTEVAAVIPPTDTVTPSDTPEPTTTSAPTLEVTATSAKPLLPTLGGADMIAFIRSNEVWVSNVDGSSPVKLTNTGGIKSGLQFTPDGEWVNYIAGRCVLSVNIATLQEKTVICLNWANYLAGFEISPDGKKVALSMSDGLFILDYDPAALYEIKRQDQLKATEACIDYTAVPTKSVLWSHDGAKLAMVIESTNMGRKEELIRVMDVSRCGQDPVRVDEFPGARFTMTGYSQKPTIQSFGWDGDLVFALNVDFRNAFGDMYTYSMSAQTAQKLNPIQNQCCYRDFRWSPDGQYILFAFEDIRFMKEVELYFVSYGILETSPELAPIAFEDGFFSSKDRPQPALRPAR
jgi:hypothetical protein